MNLNLVIVERKGDFMFLVIFLVIIIAALWLFASSIGGLSAVLYFLDIVALVDILVIVIPFLFFSGLLKDFKASFGIAMGKKKSVTLLQLKRAKQSIELVMRATALTGLLATLIQVIITLYSVSNSKNLSPNLAVALLSVLYAIAVCLFLTPIRSRLAVQIDEYMQES